MLFDNFDGLRFAFLSPGTIIAVFMSRGTLPYPKELLNALKRMEKIQSYIALAACWNWVKATLLTWCISNKAIDLFNCHSFKRRHHVRQLSLPIKRKWSRTCWLSNLVDLFFKEISKFSIWMSRVYLSTLVSSWNTKAFERFPKIFKADVDWIVQTLCDLSNTSTLSFWIRGETHFVK